MSPFPAKVLFDRGAISQGRRRTALPATNDLTPNEAWITFAAPRLFAIARAQLQLREPRLNCRSRASNLVAS